MPPKYLLLCLLGSRVQIYVEKKGESKKLVVTLLCALADFFFFFGWLS